MSIKLELDAASIKLAITNHISSQGFDLAGKIVDVALVNGRGGNGNRATIIISDDVPIEVDVVKPRPPFKPSTRTTSEVTSLSEVPKEEEITLPIDGVETDVDLVDAIMVAAEGSADPFGDPDDVMEEFFPKVDPNEVKPATSLF